MLTQRFVYYTVYFEKAYMFYSYKDFMYRDFLVNSTCSFGDACVLTKGPSKPLQAACLPLSTLNGYLFGDRKVASTLFLN